MDEGAVTERTLLRRANQLVFLCVGLLPLLPSCEGGGSPNELRIGLLTDQTGPSSSLGTDAQVAVELAVEQINDVGGVDGVPIRLIVRDSPGRDQQAAILGARELATRDDVVAIIGPVSSGEAEVAFVQASRLEVPILTGSAVVDGITEAGGGWAFRNQATNSLFYDESLPVFLGEYGVSRVALVFDDVTPFSIEAADVLRSSAPEKGVTIVDELTFEPGQTDFSSIVQAIADLDVDGLFVMSGPAEGGGIASELERQGVDLPVLGHPAQNSASFRGAAPPDISRWVVPSIFVAEAGGARATAFEDQMEARDPTPPPQPEAANYYDIVYMLAQVAGRANITADTPVEEARRAIREGLLALQDFEGVAGPVSFLASGDTDKVVYTVVFEGDRVRLLA